MQSTSNRHRQNQKRFSPSQVLHQSLARSSAFFSLDYCLQPEKNMEKIMIGKDCPLKRKLLEFKYDRIEQNLENYFEDGFQQLAELTEYYKYYTQSSILYQPTFYKMMHCHREQRKAIQYNRLKVMLELSTSVQSNTTRQNNRLENSLADSFRLLSMLKFTKIDDQSILVEKLKDKLQKDYGPSKFSSLQQLDKQYCFSKTMNLGSNSVKKQDRYPMKRPSKKCVTSKPIEQRDNKQSPLFKNKVNHVRNNSCVSVQQYSARKDDKSKIRRKKNNSMENLNILAVKEPRMVMIKESKQTEIKRKIMGMKEQIKKEKQMLIRKTESSRGFRKQVNTCMSALPKRLRN